MNSVTDRDINRSMSLEGNEILKRLSAMRASGAAKRLRVLDPKNDPFWLSHSRLRDALWIARIWHEKVRETTYDRGLHYKILSWGLECPWGKNRRVHSSPLYINVDSDFNKLVSAVRDARRWGLLPWDAIEDRKHIGLERWIDWGWLEGNREKKPFEDFDGILSYSLGVNLPEVEEIGEAELYEDDFDEIASRMVENALRENMTRLTPARYQPYYCIIVSEKSGLRDVIKEAERRLEYGFDFLNFEGQASDTQVRRFIEDRLLSNVPPEYPIRKKKIRIFYVSDYDQAGRTMPPAFIWKLFYNLWQLGVYLDIKVKPLALTQEIVEKYDLPPAPVPERSLGAKTLQDRWLREFGKIVEVDALVALHPGALEDIIVNELSRYIDMNLAKEVKDTLNRIEEEARDAMYSALDDVREDWLSAKNRLERAIEALNEDIRRGGIARALEALRSELETIKEKHNIDRLVEEYQETLRYVDVGAYLDEDWPKIEIQSGFEADESDDEWLFDSTRDPTEQAMILRKYKP